MILFYANIYPPFYLKKVKELESKLELEQTTRGRMETQINRLKEAIEKLNHDCEGLRVKEAGAQDQARKLQRQLNWSSSNRRCH